jgi:uncharacterized PurR-regulated membrane protein YhhQ (DUF165 family)
MNSFIRNTIFFIGWLLSPLTFWNDAFINIPLSYLLANIFVRFFPKNFVHTVVIFYWLTNVIGLFMMYVSGKYMIKSGKGIKKELISLILTTIVYSVILILLGRTGILKPVY